MQNLAPGTIADPHDGHACWTGAAQWMQNRPTAGVNSPQTAHVICSGVLTP
jgi:hypothetical protein